MILLGFCLGTVLFVGFSSAVLKDEDREWMSRAVAEVMLVAVGWLGICAAGLLFPQVGAVVAHLDARRVLAAAAARKRLAQHARGPGRRPTRVRPR